MKSSLSGFTLIELVIVIVVAAILAAVAIPAYNQYMYKGRRIDAKNALTAVQLAQEKYRGNSPSYTSQIASLGLTATSPQGYYTVSITSATATSYAATATIAASSTQAGDDSLCNSLSLDQNGFTASSVAAKDKNGNLCWGLK